MALVIPPGFAQVSLELRNAADPDAWYVTFGVDLSDAGGDFQGTAEQIGFTWGNTIGLQLHTSTSLTSVNLAVGQDGPDNLIVTAPVNYPGTSTGAMLPQNCAALYDKQTARAGRRGRGRMFMPNILLEGGVSQTGVIDSSLRSDLQVQATNFLDQLADPVEPAGPASPMVLLHNTGPGNLDPDPVTGFVVQSVISTQRRRLR